MSPRGFSLVEVLVAIAVSALVAGALIASGHAGWLPRLTAGRVALAFVLASLLNPLAPARAQQERPAPYDAVVAEAREIVAAAFRGA